MTIIYGIDTDKQVNPSDVRDAIVECFTQAHSDALSDLKNYVEDLSKEDFEQMKRINVRQMIRNYFDETGGDYNHPTKDSLIKVMERSKEFAENFRDNDTIQKHFNQIKTLVDALK